MTEKQFQTQAWRMYDQITTAEGVKGKVLGVNFGTKSVRAYISGSPEWVRCELIETHITGKGEPADDLEIIEQLHKRVLAQAEEIERLKAENKQLSEKISKNYLKDILSTVSQIQQAQQEKKAKMQKLDDGIAWIENFIEMIDKNQ